MEAETANSKTGNGPASSATTPLVAARHIQTGLYFCLVWINYAMRINLSVGIVAMTDSTTSPNPEIPTYNWTDKSVVLSSFYWGYIVPHFFAGQVSRIYGPTRFLPATMALGAVASMLIPVVAANFGSKGVMGCRIVQGLAQGFMFPALHHLMGKWVPISERSRTASITFSGTPFGTIVAMAVTGLISASRAGWPVSFYLFGSLGFGWILVWMLLGADSPEEHPSISEEERKYIETSLGSKENKKVATPWRSIFSSVPVWAVIVGNLGFSWGYSTLLTEIPNYLNKIMRFDMRTNGLLSAAPYLVFWILCYVSGPSADYLMNSGKMSREGVRKLFNSWGFFIPAAALLWLGYVPDDQPVLSVVLLIVAVSSTATTFVGFLINHIDLSPNHAGVLMGITNGAANLFAMVAPLVVHSVVYDETNKFLWRIVFIVAACIYVSSAILYIIFASGEVQYWNENVTTNKSEEQIQTTNDRRMNNEERRMNDE